MSDQEKRFHEVWMGMVQPVEGLVFSIPALVDAQCFEKQTVQVQKDFKNFLNEDNDEVLDLAHFLDEFLGFDASLFDSGDALPENLSLWVPEGRELLIPTLAVKNLSLEKKEGGNIDDSTPASRAGKNYTFLLWDLPGVDLDKSTTLVGNKDLENTSTDEQTGSWDYPPKSKFDRLLRACRVPIGLITNRKEFRLIYAPHGESSGVMTFRISDMASVGGRPILDAFVMLLSANRFFSVQADFALPAILKDSRNRQAEVTTALAAQVFDALDMLLAGFESAAHHDAGFDQIFRAALQKDDDHLYGGLLSVLLRLVFILYVEDRGLVPIDHPLYGEHLGLLSLFAQLQKDAGEFPDTMDRRFGAWPRLLACFRTIYHGVDNDGLFMPARHGKLFNPSEFPFLEGWDRNLTAPTSYDERAEINTPKIDDGIVFKMLEKLLILNGQRLSYQELSVEQLGSVYENLMGYHVMRLLGDSVKIKSTGVWISAEDIQSLPMKEVKNWLVKEAGLKTAPAKKLFDALKKSDQNAEALLECLKSFSSKKSKVRKKGGLVLQPGEERRRTSSHYTPRSLTESVVRKTLDPLLRTMAVGVVKIDLADKLPLPLGEGWGEGLESQQVAEKELVPASSQKNDQKNKVTVVTNFKSDPANVESLTLTLSQRERGQKLPLPLGDESKDGRGRATPGAKAEGWGEGEQRRQVDQKNEVSVVTNSKNHPENKKSLSQRERGSERIPEHLLKYAKELRTDQTDAEKIIWHFLRNRNLADSKFRRQHPIGNYIVDFYCHEKKLVVELDGSQHLKEKEKLYDQKRTKFLNEQGIEVLRFDNIQVLTQTVPVLESIFNTITSERKDKLPLPLGEGWGEGLESQQVAEKKLVPVSSQKNDQKNKVSLVTNSKNQQANKQSLTLTLSQRERGSDGRENEDLLPPSDLILALKVCDPAMGSGAFLVEACRYLADHLVAAWTRENKIEEISKKTDDVITYARRLIAQRCLYGVDKNPFAVDLAKLSMWLVTMAKDEPFTFLDHALRYGDSLVGLSLDQLRDFNWEEDKQQNIFAKEIRETIEDAVGLRHEIIAMASQDGNVGLPNDKEWLLSNADETVKRAKLIGDVIIGAFFKHSKKKDRQDELKRRKVLVMEWLELENAPRIVESQTSMFGNMDGEKDKFPFPLGEEGQSKQVAQEDKLPLPLVLSPV